MYYVTKELLEDGLARDEAHKILREIREVVDARVDCEIIAAYFLFKAKTAEGYSNLMLSEILDGSLSIEKNVLDYAEGKINEEQWPELINIMDEHDARVLCLAAYLAIDEAPISYTHSTPKSLSELAKQILKIKPSDTVADICCGVSGFISSVALDNPEVHILGYEVDAECIILSSIKADLLGTDIDIALRNSFDLLPDFNEKGRKFSKIFANYPFRLGLHNIGDGSKLIERFKAKYTWINNGTSSDWLFNALICELLEEGGTAVAIMTKGALLNKADVSAREYFVRNRLIQSVVLLPEKMLGWTNISTAMIVFHKYSSYEIQMINATQRFVPGRRMNELSEEDINSIVDDVYPDLLTGGSWGSTRAALNLILENNCFLSPDRYLRMEEDDFHPHNGVPFYTIIKRIVRGVPCTAKQLDEMSSSEPTDIQYLTTSNIQDGRIDTSGMPYLKELKPEYNKYCLKKNNFIISKNAPFKFAVADFEEGKTILANGNVYIIELDEDQISPYFLQAYFSDDYGLKLVKNISVGTTISSLSVDAIKNLEIDVPPLEKQRAIADAYKTKLDEIALLKLRLEKARGELNSVYWDNFETMYAPEC